MTTKRIKVYACAKINLFLEVLGRRPDGFHEIKSVLAPLTLADRIEVELTDSKLELIAPQKIRLEGMLNSISLGPKTENLVMKAARLLQKVAGCQAGARIYLDKQIPVAGGLGGGSADAAAALTALNQLWETGLSRLELMGLSAELGCDVPALVHGGAVITTGKGEKVSELKWHSGWRPWVLLVNPGFGVSTKDIYKRYKESLTFSPEKNTFRVLVDALKAGDTTTLKNNLHNALQQTVVNKYPLLRILADNLMRLSDKAALLSGSGATFFALVRNAEHGRELAQELRSVMQCPLWTCVAQIAGDRHAEFG